MKRQHVAKLAWFAVQQLSVEQELEGESEMMLVNTKQLLMETEKAKRQPTVCLGVFQLRDEEIRVALDSLVEHILSQIKFVDRITEKKGKYGRMLHKSGLLFFAKLSRAQLVVMKYNAIRVVARKYFKRLQLDRGAKITLKVRVLGKPYTVPLKYEYAPKMDELQTISDYRSKV